MTSTTIVLSVTPSKCKFLQANHNLDGTNSPNLNSTSHPHLPQLTNKSHLLHSIPSRAQLINFRSLRQSRNSIRSPKLNFSCVFFIKNFSLLSFHPQQLQSAIKRNETMVLAVSVHRRWDSGRGVVQAPFEAIGVWSKRQSSNSRLKCSTPLITTPFKLFIVVFGLCRAPAKAFWMSFVWWISRRLSTATSDSCTSSSRQIAWIVALFSDEQSAHGENCI